MADKANLPVLLHDSNGRKRVPILAAVWMVKAREYTVDEAIELVRSIKEQPLTEEENKFLTDLAN